MIGKVALAGSNKCPICGKEFKAEAPLVPNVEDREFYGGRVKFFKDVDCDCTAKYRLCIEQRPRDGADALNVINMIVLKVGVPKLQLDTERAVREKEEAEAKAAEAVHQAIEEKGGLLPLKQRQEIKRQTVLANIVDKDTKIETLTMQTIKELRTMCKLKRVKFNARDSKLTLAEKLLERDPLLVVANQND